MDLNIMDFFKLPTKIMVAIALATGMILFLPDELISKMYMDGFRNEYGFIIGDAIGEISDYNHKLYNERLAIALLKQYGPEFCRELLKFMKSEMN